MSTTESAMSNPALAEAFIPDLSRARTEVFGAEPDRAWQRALCRWLTSLALSCASNMLGRGREVQAEWSRTLDADRASLKA